MGMLQTTEQRPSGSLGCPGCAAVLPRHAVFCGSCGHRVVTEQKSTSLSRYRITSLLRHLPYVSLFFAIDTQQQRMVAIRDIDISSLDKEAQGEASVLAQKEYDLLRQQGIAHVMPVIDLQQSQDHLLTITGQAYLGTSIAGEAGQKEKLSSLHTLQDFLQSGVGLPDQQVALSWIGRLCQAIASLHSHQIILGDLDPQTIFLSGDDYLSELTLMVSWLLPQMRTLLSRIVSEQSEQSSPTSQATSFNAPEVLLGRVEPVADVYSLGAILYLLLTGTPPDAPMVRTHHRLRTPRELNSHISVDIDEIVMRALSFESAERFQSVEALAEALSKRRISSALAHPAEEAKEVVRIGRIAEIDTISMHPPLEGDRLLGQAIGTQMPLPAPTVEATLEQLAEMEDLPSWSDGPEPLSSLSGDAPASTSGENAAMRAVQSLRERITGMLPAIPRLSKQITGVLPAIPFLTQAKTEREQKTALAPPQTPASPSIVGAALPVPDADSAIDTTQGASIEAANSVEANVSLLKYIQRIVLGQQHLATTAPAIIEAPLRIQPGQEYNIRIRLIGRDEAPTSSETKKDVQSRGLSTYVHGELIYVEVRSAFYQSYTYFVQQAAVNIPALGYVAEVIMPMQPFATKSDGRRERLHIFFLDEKRRPLYEKPFVIELFVSRLIPHGREGHHLLPIPV